MGSSYGEKREIHVGPASTQEIKGIQVLLKDLKSLQQEGGKSGDLKFHLKDGHCVKAHSLIIKARCKRFKGETSYPHVSQDVFNTFLTCVYTGKFKIENISPLTLYPVYLLALDFGLDDLSSTCEEVMISNMDHNYALVLLQEAVASLSLPSCSKPNLIEKENGNGNISDGVNGIPVSGVSVKSAIKKLTLSPAIAPTPSPRQLGEDMRFKVQKIVDTTITYLSENNPSGLKRNTVFLSLSVETIKVMLDSEHLCLEEEEVWRCVLRWAQAKAGVEAHVSLWTEEERVAVSQYLTPVISHVKLLLIHSRVFAEEVEPTGCVPMALSLERYRTAALSTFEASLSGNGELDPRLTPRNAQKLFHSSLIINNERSCLGKKLQEWHSAQASRVNNTNWKCVYRASQHGFAAGDFHARVDGLDGPSVVLALLKNNKWICGGYTDVPWNSTKSPKYITSSKSFLFAMNPTTNGVPIQFPVTKKHFAVCHDANSGPIFGAGADLYISSNCSTNSDSYSNLPHSYEQSGGVNGSSPSGGVSESSPGSRSRSLTPNSSSSPTALDLIVAPSSINKKGKSSRADNSINGFAFAPAYHFMLADYEVFVPSN